MSFSRESGLLLHPTSLPGPYGMGDLGPEAYAFLDQLKAMGQHLWQVLPLGPTSYGDSPYQSLSTFAGNTLLISLDLLRDEGLLSASRLKRFPRFPDDRVDYGAVIPAKVEILRSVCRTFGLRASAKTKRAFAAFCEKEASWLDDYALFVALKNNHQGQPWPTWEKELVHREPKALQRARRKHRVAIRYEKLLQYLFFDQWQRLRKYAHENNIQVIGDIPIFVAHDSADVWARPELFYLDEDGQPLVVAGVPPDYFSATGQLWGNPLYRWDVHQSTGYAWWIERMRKVFELVDYVRIDHFRGFEAYWEVPADQETAMQGKWVQGPNADLFDHLLKALGPLQIIAEDLGLITPPVEELRDRFEFPGMRILQFAFGDDPKAEAYRPESYPPNCVVYTGTHDNDTTVGWMWSEANGDTTRTQEDIKKERHQVLTYLGTDGSEIHWDLIALALRSSANTTVFPIQDLLGLGSEARMNIPGSESGNWQWRLEKGSVTPEIQKRLLSLTQEAHRTRQPE